MNGKRIHVSYPGQPKLCRNCLCQGHVVKDCLEQNKTDFLDYVARLLKSGLFKEELFGSWIDSLKKYHHEFNRPNPNDLRQVMNFNQRGLQRQDLRRSIGYPTNQDLRTHIGYNREDYLQNPIQYDPQQSYQGQDQRNYNYQGRGYQRGRGRGRARGGRRGYNSQYY